MLKLKQLFGAAALMLAAGTASAGTIDTSDSFYELYNFLNTAATGGLGTGIALAALLVGAGIGAAKASALPAVAGVVVAAMFGFGPQLILDIATNGAVLAPLA